MKRLSSEEINSDVFIESVQLFRRKYEFMGNDWIQRCLDRLTDVEFSEKVKNLEKFKVYKNEKLDGDLTKSYRVVSLAGGFISPTYRQCTCFFGKGFYRARKRLCSHIGACILYKIYFNKLQVKV